MNDQRSVTDQLHDLIDLAHKNGLYDAADWVKDRLNYKPKRQPERWYSVCADCGIVNPEEDQYECSNCGSLCVISRRDDLTIPHNANIHTLAGMIVDGVCTDPMWPKTAQIRLINLLLRAGWFSARLVDFEWNPIGNAQALGFKNMVFQNDKTTERNAKAFINDVVRYGITSGSYQQSVASIETLVDAAHSLAQWVRDLRDPVSEDQVVRIIHQYLLNDYQVGFLGNHSLSLEDVLNGRFSTSTKPLIEKNLFNPWNGYLGEELFRC